MKSGFSAVSINEISISRFSKKYFPGFGIINSSERFSSFFFDKKNSLNVVFSLDDIHIEKEIIDCWNLESTNSYQLNRDLYFGIPNNKFFKNIS